MVDHKRVSSREEEKKASRATPLLQIWASEFSLQELQQPPCQWFLWLMIFHLPTIQQEQIFFYSNIK